MQHSSGAESPDGSRTVEGFFDDSWAIYSSILDQNYMYHREIYRDVREVFVARCSEGACSLLDLGCGDARFLSAALSGLPISHYRAYDVSEVALQHAAENLSVLACPTELCQGDLLDAVRTEREIFDIIFSSFAVHHLTTEQKAEFFRLAFGRLAPNGLLVMIDVTRNEGEHRSAYLDRYCDWATATWSAIAPRGLESVFAHIRERDFPETPSRLTAMAEAAGFGRVTLLPAYLFHRTMVWRKPDSPRLG